MPRKVILDVDPGIDDAMALCMALFDPDVEVVAVTAVGGNVPPALATRNVQAILAQLDPPRRPRIGAASPPEQEPPVQRRYMYGKDGLGDAGLCVAELHHVHPSEKVIGDEVRAAPEAVTIVALGPLTNIARAFQRDTDLPSMVGRLVIAGGAVAGPGNVTPAAEFNMYCDPMAARAVFRAPVTKTLIPLDITNRVVLNYDLFNQLPEETSVVGRFLRADPAADLPRLPAGVRLGGDPRPRFGGPHGGAASGAIHHQRHGRRRGDHRRADPRRDGLRPPPRAGCAAQHGRCDRHGRDRRDRAHCPR